MCGAAVIVALLSSTKRSLVHCACKLRAASFHEAAFGGHHSLSMRQRGAVGITGVNDYMACRRGYPRNRHTYRIWSFCFFFSLFDVNSSLGKVISSGF